MPADTSPARQRPPSLPRRTRLLDRQIREFILRSLADQRRSRKSPFARMSSIRTSPASGPSRITTATAWFKATTGDGSIRSKASYSSTI
jgi:hypothetical protein